jgi:hypothetical protein
MKIGQKQISSDTGKTTMNSSKSTSRKQSLNPSASSMKKIKSSATINHNARATKVSSFLR